MTQFNSEGLVRLQTYMAGKTLSDSQAIAVASADVVEMQDAAESETRRRYYRVAEDDESITFSCILGMSQQQMVVTKATKQLSVTTVELGGAIASGSITGEMLADDAVTGSKIASRTIQAQNLADGAVTSEKLAEGLDVSGLFFILPDGTQFPYTLTEEDKTKLENAVFLVAKDQTGRVYVASPSGLPNKLQGIWYGIADKSTAVQVLLSSNGAMQEPVKADISDPFAVKFRVQSLNDGQKTQARANIGAAEDVSTSGDEGPIQ